MPALLRAIVCAFCDGAVTLHARRLEMRFIDDAASIRARLLSQAAAIAYSADFRGILHASKLSLAAFDTLHGLMIGATNITAFFLF